MFRVEPVEWDAFPKWLWILSGSKAFPWDDPDLSWLSSQLVSLDSPGETSKLQVLDKI